LSVAIDRTRIWVLLAGAILLAALAVAQIGGSLDWLAVVLAIGGGVGAATLVARRAAAVFRRHRELVFVGLLIALAVLWVVLTLDRLGRYRIAPGPPLLGRFLSAPLAGNWPWPVGHAALLPLMLMLLSVATALVLIADAVRLRLGLAPRSRAPWREITDAPATPGGIVPRALAGIALVALAVALAIGLANPYVQNSRGSQILGLLLIGLVAAAIIGVPALIGSQLRLDRDKATTERERERQRFAAHLHDSVLQTLALVQRQAQDPAAVTRLARRQEYALRAWMAGETELVSDTLVAALRDTVAGVEDEHGINVELTVIGDRPLNGWGEAVIAATREALRNAARHAPGSNVFVFAEISERNAEVFVRDDGPGFEPDDVPRERRGIRDAIVGRMASAGGQAVIDSSPGTGTEVALRIGAVRSER
jgi:signal transduction histidine kinase